MKWWGPTTKLQTLAETDGVRFRATGQRRIGDLILPVLAGIGFVIELCRKGGIGPLFGLGALVALPLWYWLCQSVTELKVTEFELSATGDLGNTLDRSLRLRWTEVSGIEFRYGGEDESRGLYVRQGRWSRTCIMPNLDEDQTNQVIAAIYQRFPDLVMADAGQGRGSLFGSSGDPITLGLSKGNS